MRIRPITGIVLLLLAGSCVAHSELPDAQWCENGRIVEVGQFTINPGTTPPAAEVCRSGGSGTRDCGQFDDDYERARDLASAGCGAHSLRQPESGDIGSVIFVAVQPASFLAEDHHAAYSIDQGVSGVCLRCDRPVLPVSPIRSSAD